MVFNFHTFLVCLCLINMFIFGDRMQVAEFDITRTGRFLGPANTKKKKVRVGLLKNKIKKQKQKQNKIIYLLHVTCTFSSDIGGSRATSRFYRPLSIIIMVPCKYGGYDRGSSSPTYNPAHSIFFSKLLYCFSGILVSVRCERYFFSGTFNSPCYGKKKKKNTQKKNQKKKKKKKNLSIPLSSFIPLTVLSRYSYWLSKNFKKKKKKRLKNCVGTNSQVRYRSTSLCKATEPKLTTNDWLIVETLCFIMMKKKL